MRRQHIYERKNDNGEGLMQRRGSAPRQIVESAPRSASPGLAGPVASPGHTDVPQGTMAACASAVEQDSRLLAEMDKKLQMIRDYVVGVVQQKYTGLFVFGPPGTSKSYTVREELDKNGANYILHNSRLTGQVLFHAISQAPDAIHVLEDMEGLFSQANARGVLRSALWGQRTNGGMGPMERWVTWGSSGKRPREYRVLFTGALIMTSNKDLDSACPELDAVKKRIPCTMHAPSNAEICALLRHLARKGWDADGHHLEPYECEDVIAYLIGQSSELQRPLDLRLMELS